MAIHLVPMMAVVHVLQEAKRARTGLVAHRLGLTMALVRMGSVLLHLDPMTAVVARTSH